MNIALAPSEIAQFLEFSLPEVLTLWDRRDLKRSIQVDHRSSPELSHSSVFDVLEFHIRTDILDAREQGSEVEAWLCAVDELVESQTWDGRSFEDLVFDLMQIYLDFSGTTSAPGLVAIRASRILTAYFNLLGYVERETVAEARQTRTI